MVWMAGPRRISYRCRTLFLGQTPRSLSEGFVPGDFERPATQYAAAIICLAGEAAIGGTLPVDLQQIASLHLSTGVTHIV